MTIVTELEMIPSLVAQLVGEELSLVGVKISIPILRDTHNMQEAQCLMKPGVILKLTENCPG